MCGIRLSPDAIATTGVDLFRFSNAIALNGFSRFDSCDAIATVGISLFNSFWASGAIIVGGACYERSQSGPAVRSPQTKPVSSIRSIPAMPHSAAMPNGLSLPSDLDSYSDCHCRRQRTWLVGGHWCDRPHRSQSFQFVLSPDAMAPNETSLFISIPTVPQSTSYADSDPHCRIQSIRFSNATSGVRAIQ
ncbi:hypothetical protein [Laspinema olomoucense]|uniref:hypothetical protein n=1 Tax=Laspinema olomoucense TaxID=3231600 RepID=UPI0021BB32D6|nr:hypothetical protein [Laspinema sp. D3c]MCT7992456.1 hypothetical protein [Laspinema sp. D3c]